ncbi:MAG: hypothetical protein AB1489_26985 [Acidobacteriota bacterium]
MSKPRQVYHCSWRYLLLKMLKICTPIAVLSTPMVYYVYSGRGPLDQNTLQVTVVVLLFTLLILSVSSLVYLFLFPLRVTEAGLYGHNARGRKQFLAWSDIIYTGLVHNGGFPCHRLQSRAVNIYILIPTFLSSFDQLANELKSHGIDLQSPVTVALEQPIVTTRQQRKTTIVPQREGNYIVVSTERARSK